MAQTPLSRTDGFEIFEQLAGRTVPDLVARVGPRRSPIASAVLLLAALAQLSRLSVSSGYPVAPARRSP